MTDIRFAFVAVLIGTVLLSGCFYMQENGNGVNYTNYTYQTNQTTIEYANCTAGQPNPITAVNYSPDSDTPSYLRQISEPSGKQVSLIGTIKSMVLAGGTRSEWWYNYLEADNGTTYILYGRHWSGYPNFEYGNFKLSSEVPSPKLNITGQMVTIYPMGKEETSYGQYGPQDGILITSIEGYEPMCCYQKQGSSYSPLICIWK